MKFVLLFALGIAIGIAEPTPKRWYERANFYQIYPRSFMDSNGDGVGDLIGIREKVQYLKDIGIDGAWLSPIFQSPMVDFGYDISNFRDIQPEYGTLEDFDALVAKCKEVGLKLILDFVPNHTSNKHAWFAKSENKEPGFEDYYVWHPGKIVDGKRVPPNNWNSVFMNSAWEWSEKRQEYYLHQFLAEQPDLNYRNPKVVQEMKDTLTYWMDRGVDGFRVDAIIYMFEDAEMRDEPLSNTPGCSSIDACYLKHVFTIDQPETVDMVQQWRELLEDYTKEKGGDPKVLLMEAYSDLEHIMELFGTTERPGAQVPFNFVVLSNTNINSTGRDFFNLAHQWLDAMPEGSVANWVLGNHDNKRMSSRLGVGRQDVLMIFLQTMPGIAVNYYGEEIQMVDTYIPWSETLDTAACRSNPDIFDSISRDPARTPMQWDDSQSAGFSNSSRTWLPVAADYTTNNVKNQLAAPRSHLKMFKKLLHLRKYEAVLQEGSYEAHILNDDVVVYRRMVEGVKAYYVVLNFGKGKHTVDVKKVFPEAPKRLQVVVSSLNSKLEEG
jgi:alpha-glucosidase